MKAKNVAMMMALMVPGVAFALPITVQITSIVGTWGNIEPVSVNGAGTSTITWGLRPTAAGPSSYVFSSAVSPGTEFLAEEEFTLGTFTHNNFPVFPPFLESADLSVDIDGVFSDGVTSSIFSLTSVFSFDHLETTNSATPCAAGGFSPCPDLVTLTQNTDASTTVLFGDDTFGFNLSGFQVDGVNLNSFVTQENQANTANLRASFSALPNTVPAPTTLSLMALCLLLLARRASRARTGASSV